MHYKPYSLHNLDTLPQLKYLRNEQKRDIEIVGSVLPFRTNNYVTEQLIDWSAVPNDPMYITTFPQKEMLQPSDYECIGNLFKREACKQEIDAAADEIRKRLNPHPSGQMEHNVPVHQGEKLYGIQHKYRETVLFFPGQGQTCHAFCTFCFRWPQFTGMEELKIATREIDLLKEYLLAHPEVTDVLFTGGDPMVIKSKILARYIEPLLTDELPNLKTIRIGTKALSYWPYRFVTDDDAEELLDIFKKVRDSGRHLAFMAQFNHPVELKTDIVKDAIARIQDTGAIIRTQSPLLRHINDAPEIWAEMWRRQVDLNCIPYYMFVARDTGAHHYFSVPLMKAWEIYQKAFQSVSGVCRMVGGPSMSCLPGKVQILGPGDMQGEKVMVLRMIQGRNPDWVGRPFFAEYNEDATWYNELIPAFGEQEFFFENELRNLLIPGETEVFYE